MYNERRDLLVLILDFIMQGVVWRGTCCPIEHHLLETRIAFLPHQNCHLATLDQSWKLSLNWSEERVQHSDINARSRPRIVAGRVRKLHLPRTASWRHTKAVETVYFDFLHIEACGWLIHCKKRKKQKVWEYKIRGFRQSTRNQRIAKLAQVWYQQSWIYYANIIGWTRGYGISVWSGSREHAEKELETRRWYLLVGKVWFKNRILYVGRLRSQVFESISSYCVL